MGSRHKPLVTSLIPHEQLGDFHRCWLDVARVAPNSGVDIADIVKLKAPPNWLTTMQDGEETFRRLNHSRLGLTAWEWQIVTEIVSGASNTDIAVKLAISEKDVKRHLSDIYDKLGVSNRLELALRLAELQE